jgi:DNA repair protein RecO (recombination protein O)
MPSLKSEAVILQVTDYAEFDKIVSFYTKSYGRIRGIAKGAKRSQRRFGGALEPFTHDEVTFFEKEGHGLARLEDCRIINTFPALGKDIKKIAYGNYLIELVNTLTPEREQHPEIFTLLLYFLNLLSEHSAREDILRIFEIRLTTLLGYQPQVLRCVSCGRDYILEEIYRFSVKKGGILCSGCHRENEAFPCLSHGTIKIFQQAQQLSLEKLNRIHFSPASRAEGKLILSRFLEYHIGRKPKSLEFVEQIS